MPKPIKTLQDLTPDTKNANKGTQRGRGQLETSMRKFGFLEPGVLDKDGNIIGGNKRTEVAGSLGLDDPIVIETDGTRPVYVQRTDLDLTSKRGREAAIALNRTAQTGIEFDADVLQELIGEGIDVSEFFFDNELEALFATLNETPGDGLLPDADPDAIPENVETRCKPGDLWQLGRHRLLCGDCTDFANVERVLCGNRVDCMLTDPPYGLGDTASVKNNYDVHVDTQENLVQLISDVLPIGQQYADRIVLTPGNANQWLYPKPDWVMAWFTPAGVGSGPWGFCCWQPILCYGKDPYLQHGKGRHPDALVHTEAAEKLGHPCSKPVKFWAWLLERVTAANGSILEPFAGSGTAFIAAEELKRVCYGIELSPKYCDIILTRWEQATGKTATLIEN